MVTKVSEINNNVTVNDLSEQMKVLKQDLASLTDQLGTFTKDKTAQAGETAKETAREYADLGMAKAAETQRQAEDFIRTQPATALGIAAGVGFLIGMITARR